MLIDNDKKITRRNSLDLLAQLIEVPASYNPDRLLEITLLRAQPTENPEETVEVVKSLEKSPEKQEKIEAIKEPLKDKSKDVKTVETAKSNLEINQDLWGEILNALKKQHNTLYGVVRMAQPDFSNKGELSLAFAFEFHKKRLSEANNKKVLSDVIHNLTGQSIIIDCTLDKNATPLTVETKAPEPKDESADVKTISNIFNGAEVLES
jgi:NADH:ubiquinone oxidoreductase subunit C